MIRYTEIIQNRLLSVVVGTENPFESVLELYCSIVAEYKDIFEEPCAPAQYTINHCICLIDEHAPPPRFRQYRRSPVELPEVHYQLDDMLAR